MTPDDKNDLCATLDRVKDAIVAGRILSHAERIAYNPKYASDGSVAEYVPAVWYMDATIQLPDGAVGTLHLTKDLNRDKYLHELKAEHETDSKPAAV